MKKYKVILERRLESREELFQIKDAAGIRQEF